MKRKTLFIATLLLAGTLVSYTDACTRVVYIGQRHGRNRQDYGLERRFKVKYLRVSQRD